MERVVYRSQHFIADTHPDFEGHFPGMQVFPAVSQVELVVELLCASLQIDVLNTSISKAKFKSLLRPNTQVEVEFTVLKPGEGRWVLRTAVETISMGDLSFTPQDVTASSEVSPKA